MNTKDYKDYFTSLLNVAGIEMANPELHVGLVVKLGLKDFWGAGNWRFKEYEYSLALTTGDEVYDLPEDFAGFRSFREEGSAQGLKLHYIPYERFQAETPKLSQYAVGKPEAFTVFRDAADNNKWKIKFRPAPETITLYCGLVKDTGNDCSEVPDHLQSCLEAFIAKKIYPHGTPQRRAAQEEALLELRRCEVIDNPDKSSIDVMPSTEEGFDYD